MLLLRPEIAEAQTTSNHAAATDEDQVGGTAGRALRFVRLKRACADPRPACPEIVPCGSVPSVYPSLRFVDGGEASTPARPRHKLCPNVGRCSIGSYAGSRACAGIRSVARGVVAFLGRRPGAGIVTVAPAEGAGQTAQHFELHRVCDAGSDLDDTETWRPLRENPPRTTAADPAGFRARSLLSETRCRRKTQVLRRTWSRSISRRWGGSNGRTARAPESEPTCPLRPVPGRVALAGNCKPSTSRASCVWPCPVRLPADPGHSYWTGYGAVERCCRAWDGKRCGLRWRNDRPLLALSPLGMLMPAMPNILVFCFGEGAELRRPTPISFASICRPGVLNDPAGLCRLPSLAALDASDGPQLLAWWVECMNRLYSHATDPTRFTDGDGYHDAPAQMAWMITLERLLGDALSLLAEPQASDVQRVQIAFDLLDKTESLLGYERQDSGRVLRLFYAGHKLFGGSAKRSRRYLAIFERVWVMRPSACSTGCTSRCTTTPPGSVRDQRAAPRSRKARRTT